LVLFWFGFGLVLVWFWFGFGLVLVWFWFGFGLVLVWFWFGFGLVWFGFGLVLFACVCAGIRDLLSGFRRRPCAGRHLLFFAAAKKSRQKKAAHTASPCSYPRAPNIPILHTATSWLVPVANASNECLTRFKHRKRLARAVRWNARARGMIVILDRRVMIRGRSVEVTGRAVCLPHSMAAVHRCD